MHHDTYRFTNLFLNILMNTALLCKNKLTYTNSEDLASSTK